ncbi:MAG TPA: DUF4956 domain-containing protein [Prolixibacteraceae bacterium]|nr:DUF4956 domain-containing protein [Prolixibacteraceae bacterium]HPR59864.1 DUF4956 domain-containing protein [Prolixibacteraceae bacterium]
MELFNIDIINLEDFTELLFRFLFNFVVVFIAIRLLYYKVRRRRDYLFTFILISTVVFLLCFLLESVKLGLGFALGLFAIFGIIRYRTQQIPIKEMTYLFLVIGISVINALANKKISYAELIVTNGLLLLVTWGLERMMMLRHESRKQILYEKIELIKPENRLELKADLENRTGLTINRIEIGKVDFLRDTARINIYYYEDENTADDESTAIADDDDD